MECGGRVALHRLVKGRSQTFELRLPYRVSRRSLVKSEAVLESAPGRGHSTHRLEADRSLEFLELKEYIE